MFMGPACEHEESTYWMDLGLITELLEHRFYGFVSIGELFRVSKLQIIYW